MAVALPVRTRSPLAGVDALARQAGLHPSMVRRLLELGLVQQRGASAGDPLFSAQDAALLARAVRLRRDLGLNYAGAVLACELLSRIDELERRLETGAPVHTRHEVIAWTRTG
ncbi:MAG: chaperone modulator CbpM [Solirubrobacteraceae bacterium]